MTGFAERVAEDRRGAVLRILTAVEGHALNEDLLVRELARQRFGLTTQDDMRGILAWLERQALVTVQRLEGDVPGVPVLWAASATRAGRDVARGATWPGVAAPL
jgi:hypothetical protein